MAKCVDAAPTVSGDTRSPARIRVVGALVMSGGRVLLTRRRKEQVHGGYWEFPGGKVEPGESDREALARELREELGVGAEVGEHVCTVTHGYSGFVIDLAIYRCVLGDQTPACREVEAVSWVPVNDLERLELTPPDRAVARWIRERGAA